MTAFEPGDLARAMRQDIVHFVARVGGDRFAPSDPGRWPWTRCGYRVEVGWVLVDEAELGWWEMCRTCDKRRHDPRVAQ